MEGALKIKEISYIHAEAYAAGELKHGPLALLTSSTPVIAIVAQDPTYEKMRSNVGEVSARGSPVLAIGTEGDKELPKFVDDVIEIQDRKSTRLNSSHDQISYAVFCLKKQTINYPIMA